MTDIVTETLEFCSNKHPRRVMRAEQKLVKFTNGNYYSVLVYRCRACEALLFHRRDIDIMRNIAGCDVDAAWFEKELPDAVITELA